jgi:predicted ATP-grasp superfamily ATP-dependent carboligase
LVPDFADDPDAFAARVLELVDETPTTVVLPTSDQSVASLRPWRSRIERHAALALAPEAALALAVDKRATLQVAAQLGIGVPRSAVIAGLGDLPAALADIGCPAVVKPAMSWSRERGGERVVGRDVLVEREASEAVGKLLNAGVGALVQQWVSGRREAVSLLRVGGKVVAEFAQLAFRCTPVLGGASVVRESIPVPADLRAAAVSLVDAIDLDGYAEVEFRRDARGRPLLMEVNPRLSGSVELAVRSGVDFPLMLWQWAANRPVEGASGYKIGVRLRWLTGDGRWLLETLRRPGRPDGVPPTRALATFAGDFTRLDAYDFLDVSDLLPAFAELRRVVAKLGTKVAKRTTRLIVPNPVPRAM